MVTAVQAPILTGAQVQAKYDRAAALVPTLSRAGQNTLAEQLLDELDLVRMEMREVQRAEPAQRQLLLRKIAARLDAAMGVKPMIAIAELEEIAAINKDDDDEWLTWSEIGQRLGGRSTVYNWVHSGKLPCIGEDSEGMKLHSFAAAQELDAKRKARKSVDKSAKPVAKSAPTPVVKAVENIPEPMPAPPPATIALKPTKWSLKDKPIRNSYIPEPFRNGWEVA